jgi:succinate dehydrogenase hydrophobic anchor subunit
MHCVAGDGLGILAGAVISSAVGIAGLAEVIVEYVLGFGFGWTIFQALFMRDAAGGSYRAALANTFVPELLSMNLLMAGMVHTVMMLREVIKSANDPTTPNFWFVMSMGLLVGFIIAYPMNWWLVANHLKHGMMTVRPTTKLAGMADHGAHPGMGSMMGGMAGMAPAGAGMSMGSGQPTGPPIPVMTLLSFLALAGGVALGFLVRLM